MKYILRLNDFSIDSSEYNIKLLKNINFSIGEKEIHCVLGKNGCGKSTLAYALMGLERYRQSGGRIFLMGKLINSKKTYERAKLGMTLAFQEPARFEGLTVRDFLLAGNPKLIDEELKKALKLVDLSDTFLDRSLDEKLSGGERKRIEIASVILMKPKLIIMDEPDASLDIIVYNEFYDLLLKIREDIGCSILLITHREEAGLVADKATLIDNGEVVKSGKFREVMGEYCNRMGRRAACMRTKNCTKCE